MANLTRKQQKVFAGSASNNGQFGSLQAGTKITTTDPDVIQALSAFNNGWNDAVIGGEELPALEEFQGLHFLTTRQISYLLDKGIPEWEVATEYFIGDIQREVGGTRIYKSITDNNIGNALTDVVNWEFLIDLNSNLGTTSGAADVYTTNSPTSEGGRYIVEINTTNTGASTLNGTAMEKFDGAGSLTALEAGDLQQDQYYDILDNGTKIVVLNPQLPYITSTNFTVTDPTIQKFTSGSGTYTTPANVRYIRVRMVGGGGGGAGSATTAGNDHGSGGTGGNTTFGTSLLVANGGGGGTGSGVGGTGGTATVNSPAIGTGLDGGNGGNGGTTVAGNPQFGDRGSSSFFGGASGSGRGASITNTGSGGNAAVANPSSFLGGSGGAGAYVEAIITSPSATYSYAVGAAGAGGTAGTGGNAGGAGGSGYIEVTEYY